MRKLECYGHALVIGGLTRSKRVLGAVALVRARTRTDVPPPFRFPSSLVVSSFVCDGLHDTSFMAQVKESIIS